MVVNVQGAGPLQHQDVASDIRRLGSDLLNQQMWCWGSDIRRAEGNLLRQYGFTKLLAPEGTSLKPCYVIDAAGVSIRLWGFGMYFADSIHGGLFLKRFEFIPRMIDPSALTPDIWRTRDLPHTWAPRSDEDIARSDALLSESCAWIAAYERWVQARAGSDWRHATVEAWRGMHKRVVADGNEMAGRWADLSRHFRAGTPATTGGH